MQLELKQRWSPEQTREVNSQLASGGELASPFSGSSGESGALCDLRGMVINCMVQGVVLDRVDFSFCTFEGSGQFVETSCTECVFVEADLATNLGTRFIRCDLKRAKLNVLRGSFEDCNFRDADLVAVLGRSLHFVRCDFSGANFRKANLFASIFDRCNWSGTKFGGGSFADSTFIGQSPTEDSLKRTIVDGVKLLPV